MSGGVRSGTLPPWSRDVARIAFPPGPAGSSNAQVPILSGYDPFVASATADMH